MTDIAPIVIDPTPDVEEIDDLLRQLRAKIDAAPFEAIEYMVARQKLARDAADDQVTALLVDAQAEWLAAATKTTRHRADFLHSQSGHTRGGYMAMQHNEAFAAAPLVGDMLILKATQEDGGEGSFHFAGDMGFDAKRDASQTYEISVVHSSPIDFALLHALEPSDDVDVMKQLFNAVKHWNTRQKVAVVIWILKCGKTFDLLRHRPDKIPISVVPNIATLSSFYHNWSMAHIAGQSYLYKLTNEDIG